MIKNIIWDWNGTIVDDASLFVEIMNCSLRRSNLKPITLNDYKNLFRFPIVDFWKLLGFQFNDVQFNKMNSLFIENYKKQMFSPYLHNNIESTFKRVSQLGVNQFIVSASENTILNTCVKHYKINKYFQDISGVNNLNALGKLNVAENLILKHSLDIDTCLFIGDTEHDAEIAIELGAKVLLVSYGHIAKKRLLKTSCPVIDHIAELFPYIKNGANK